MVHIDYRDARPIYAQIVDGYRTQIVQGILTEGEKLPSVRELAATLFINPNTIQRAYRQLESEGWIATVPGKGCFVCALPNQEEPDIFSEFDRAAAALLDRGLSLEELIERLSKEGNDHA